jgi:hypothetical protein
VLQICPAAVAATPADIKIKAVAIHARRYRAGRLSSRTAHLFQETGLFWAQFIDQLAVVL